MNEKADVVIVGAGVVGGAVAYYLSKENVKVLLVEKEGIGAGGGHGSGLLLKTGADFPPEIFWLGMESFKMAKDLVATLEEETGINTSFQSVSMANVALEEREVEGMKKMLSGDQGTVEHKWLTRDEVRKEEPRITENVIGAFYYPEYYQLDGYCLPLAYVSAAEKRGAELLLREVIGLEVQKGKVTGVVTKTGKIACDKVVIAMGAWSGAASSWLNFPVPVRPLKGERLELKWDGEPFRLMIMSFERGHILHRKDGFISVGSTGGRVKDYEGRGEQIIDFSNQPTERAKFQLLQSAIDVMPCLQEAKLVRQLAGPRPLSDDRLPLIGPVPTVDNVYLATGHGTRGIYLSFITGKIVADLVLKGKTDVPFSLKFADPARFGCA